jgi:hypothetical protein
MCSFYELLYLPTSCTRRRLQSPFLKDGVDPPLVSQKGDSCQLIELINNYTEYEFEKNRSSYFEKIVKNMVF